MIIRAVHNRNNPYFMVRRATAQDKGLTARALGVLTYLFSKPDSWEPCVEDICRRFKDVGQKQAYKIINEIFIPLRYARRVQERSGGRIIGWVTEIYEAPVGENCQLDEPEPDGSFEHVAPPDGTYQMAVLTNIDNKEEKVQIEKLQSQEITDIGADAQTPAKPSKAKREPDARTYHVAIQTVREIMSQYPPKELWDKVIQTLGDTPNIALLVECRTEWVERGYNKNSWKWATEWYATGVPARTVGGPPKQSKAAYVGAIKPTKERQVTAEDLAFMEKHIDDLIAANDFIHLADEYDAIIQRGGAKAEWEIRCVAWYELHKSEPATPEQMAQLNASIQALAKR